MFIGFLCCFAECLFQATVLPFSWIIFLFFCKIFYLLSTHLLKINWHFFLNLWFALLNVLMLSEAQFLFLYIAFLHLSPGWPGIPKAGLVHRVSIFTASLPRRHTALLLPRAVFILENNNVFFLSVYPKKPFLTWTYRSLCLHWRIFKFYLLPVGLCSQNVTHLYSWPYLKLNRNSKYVALPVSWWAHSQCSAVGLQPRSASTSENAQWTHLMTPSPCQVLPPCPVLGILSLHGNHHSLSCFWIWVP